MAEMTTHERVSRMYQHRDADRVPITDYPWHDTIERWRREGMPDGVDWVDYFGADHFVEIHVDTSPRYPERTLEETPEYKVSTTRWGATLKNWTHASSTPEFMDFVIKDPATWAAAKARMTPTPDRINWEHLKANYPRWKDQGAWIVAGLWFGFDVTHSWTIGTTKLLMALVEQPEWCVDMFNHFLDVNLTLLDQVWEAGYRFDEINWPDDLGYKGHQFISLPMYRELLKPAQKRACDWAHAKGVRTRLHSCGDVNPFVPEFIEIGIDALNPLEVKAGMNPAELKQRYGKDLVFHGGINAVLWDNAEAIEAEIRRVLPAMKQNGGYIFSSDHSIPNSVSLANMKRIVAAAKAAGRY